MTLAKIGYSKHHKASTSLHLLHFHLHKYMGEVFGRFGLLA
jgi:hypothetical protein